MAHGNLYSIAHSLCFAAFDFLCLEQVCNLQWTGTVIEKKPSGKEREIEHFFSDF